MAYRVIQEGLTNAHKHGAEHRAHVLITIGADTVTVVVTNPSLPREQHPSDGNDSARGHGLLGVRERVAAARGTVSAGPASGGWQVTATLPLAPGENS